MGTRTFWICDGCDEQIVAPTSGSDWKMLLVDITGSKGYPLCGAIDGPHNWLLCPDCQRRLADAVTPTSWARAPKPAPVEVS